MRCDNGRRIGRIRHHWHAEEEPEMETDVLIPVTSYGVDVMPIGPDGGGELETWIGFGRNFHSLVERTVGRNG